MVSRMFAVSIVPHSLCMASKIASDAWGAESDLAQRMRKAYSPRTEGASDAPDPGSGRDPHSQGPRGPGVGPDGMIVFNRGGR